MTKPNPEGDDYIGRAQRWPDEIRKLRAILLDCDLDEDLKWGKPCYSFQGGNLAIVQSFKEHCSLMFFKGSLLEDHHDVLVPPGENSRAAMRIQFTSVSQVGELETAVRDYVRQAAEIEKAGLKVDLEASPDPELPAELTALLDTDPELAASFPALTPGRRRAYVLHVSGAKQSKTRTARVEKARGRILAGKGPNER